MNHTVKTSQVEILITGGTLDKDYHPLLGELVFPRSDEPSHVLQLLQQANVCTPDGQDDKFKLINLMQIDSLQMKKKQRMQIAKALLKCASKQIVITHGTDTMVKTAKKLIKLIAEDEAFTSLKNKTIVLTGAMRPFALGNSDASFNLGAASTAVQTLPSGVYICMNGNIHKGSEVNKDYQKGVFISSA